MSQPQSRLSVAIVGSGIAGLTAAYAFSKEGHSVTIFESAERLGIDSTSVNVVSCGKKQRIDTPPRAISASYYPNLLALYRDAGIELQPWSWAWSYLVHGSARPFLRVSGGANGRRAAAAGGGGLGGGGSRQPQFESLPEVNDVQALLQLFHPRTLLMLLDAVRFHVFLRRDSAEECEGLTLREYLAAREIGRAFVERLLLPVLAMVCTCSYDAVLGYPVVVLRAYLTTLSSHNQYRAANGTDHTANQLARLVAATQLGARVRCVVAAEEGVEGARARVHYTAAHESVERCEHFHHVVLATPADVSAQLVGASRPSLAAALRCFAYETSSVLLHRHPCVMPPLRKDWSVASIVIARDLSRAMFTLHANNESCLAVAREPAGAAEGAEGGSEELFMTWAPLPECGPQLHPAASVDPAAAGAGGALRLPLSVQFRRSVVTPHTRAAVARLWEEEQGRGGVWVAGAYAAYSIPLQESASLSAVRVARAAGVACAWAAPSAALPPVAARAVHELRGASGGGGEAREALTAARARHRALAEALALALAAAGFALRAAGAPSLLLPARTPAPLRGAYALGAAALGALVSEGEADGSVRRIALYFGICALALGGALGGWPWRRALARAPALALAAPALCGVAVCSTWSRIALWFVEHRAAWDRAPARLPWSSARNSFVQAYVEVADAPARWWWASQLLLLVAVLCAWAYTEWPRARVPAASQLAYVAAGFAIAISAALPLGLAHAVLVEPQGARAPRAAAAEAAARGRAGARGLVGAGVVLAAALGSALLLPASLRAGRGAFAACLAVLHSVLALPFVARALGGGARAGRPLSARGQALLFAGLAAVCTASHLANTRDVWLALAAAPSAPPPRGSLDALVLALRGVFGRAEPSALPVVTPPSVRALVAELARAVMSGLCIQSISLDLVLSTLGTAALAASRLGVLGGVLPYVLAPFISSGAVCALQFALLSLFDC